MTTSQATAIPLEALVNGVQSKSCLLFWFGVASYKRSPVTGKTKSFVIIWRPIVFKKNNFPRSCPWAEDCVSGNSSFRLVSDWIPDSVVDEVWAMACTTLADCLAE